MLHDGNETNGRVDEAQGINADMLIFYQIGTFVLVAISITARLTLVAKQKKSRSSMRYRHGQQFLRRDSTREYFGTKTQQ